MPAAGLSSPRLRRLARGPDAAAAVAAAPEERCELCGRPIEAAHRHLLDLDSGGVACVCRPCALLFERPAAAGRLRTIPERPRALTGVELPDDAWAALEVPVRMAWFVRDSAADRVRAFYPSPLGPTASQLPLAAWQRVQSDAPDVREMTPDVEALLVNRTDRRPGQWIVPITDCYRLVAVVRTHWHGFTGGGALWPAVGDFFDDLDRRARLRHH